MKEINTVVADYHQIKYLISMLLINTPASRRTHYDQVLLREYKIVVGSQIDCC